MELRNVCACAVVALAGSAVVRADVMNDWQSQYRQAIREIGGGPGPLSRIGAVMNIAIYDSVQSISQTHQTYRDRISGYENASMEAATAAAAHRVLSSLASVNGGLQASYDATLAIHLNAIADVDARNLGVALGNQIADNLMGFCDTDGWADEVKYVPTMQPGTWNPTFPDYTAPITPHWGNLRPWTLETSDQFRPPAAPAMDSERYAQEFNQVKELGARNSATRTADQTESAFFWANDMDGTFKPPGHLNSITEAVADSQNLSLEEKARLFAMVSVSMADAAIVAWDAKYNTDYDMWRPIEGIMRADEDGNDATDADPNWVPLAQYTPAFPAYTSGHATFAAAHAGAMQAFFGTDDISFTVGTDDPDAIGVLRSFDSFSEAALENALSRMYLGVHWWADGEYGLESGYSVADWIAANYFLAVPTPGAVLAMGAMLGLAAVRRRR